jgi:hypothetical protein
VCGCAQHGRGGCVGVAAGTGSCPSMRGGRAPARQPARVRWWGRPPRRRPTCCQPL